ncbi:MAG: MFS transporter [bacterium]
MESAPTNSHEVKGLKLILRSLRHKNFRLFFFGQSISLVGTWMQIVAMGWLVFNLTRSMFLLGAVEFASQIPAFLFGPLAGVMIDRWNRRRLLIITQTLAMVQAFILAALALTGQIATWHIISLSIFIGLVNGFDIPARQAFFVDMIDKKEDLGNAIALNSSMFNGARLIGPSIAGITIALVGEGICFLLNGITFLAVIAALLAMKINQKPKDASKSSYIIHELQDGFTYTFGSAPIRSVLQLLALISFMGMPYAVLMPIFAKNVLHGGPDTLGFLIAASGVGALLGAIYLAAQRSVLGLGKMIAISAGIFGVGIVAFSQSRALFLSLFLLLLVGFGIMVQIASSNTLLQTIVEEDKRGRVMSFFTMSFIGMEPLGSLLAGGLASMIGAPNTLMIGGICCIAGSVIFAIKLPALSTMIYPLYVKMGAVPGVTPGIQMVEDTP